LLRARAPRRYGQEGLLNLTDYADKARLGLFGAALIEALE
jgi:hypothetical protein